MSGFFETHPDNDLKVDKLFPKPFFDSNIVGFFSSVLKSQLRLGGIKTEEKKSNLFKHVLTS